MSYRLITRATLTIVAATGVTTTRDLEVRAYPAPKRDAAGAITVDGQACSYKRTGGKGRGTADRRYAYAPVKGESAYFEITEAEAAAMIGGTVTLATIAVQAPAAAPVVQIDGPTIVVDGIARPADSDIVKAPRRVKGQAKATAEA